LFADKKAISHPEENEEKTRVITMRLQSTLLDYKLLNTD